MGSTKSNVHWSKKYDWQQFVLEEPTILYILQYVFNKIHEKWYPQILMKLKYIKFTEGSWSFPILCDEFEGIWDITPVLQQHPRNVLTFLCRG